MPRLARATSILTASSASPIKRSKPLKYAYEKEIVLYAHHKKLDYFSTECIYSPEAFRGSARALIKSLERIRPSAILDVVRSGEDMARCVPLGSDHDQAVLVGSAEMASSVEEDVSTGCGSSNGGPGGNAMADMERRLDHSRDFVIEGMEEDFTRKKAAAPVDKAKATTLNSVGTIEDGVSKVQISGSDKRTNRPIKRTRKVVQQQMGQCERCGYLSSQAICKACMLLEGLNRSRPRTAITMDYGGIETTSNSRLYDLAVG